MFKYSISSVSKIPLIISSILYPSSPFILFDDSLGLPVDKVFPWSSWQEEFDSLPEVWHHDIYLPDKTPFDQKEIDFLKDILIN